MLINAKGEELLASDLFELDQYLHYKIDKCYKQKWMFLLIDNTLFDTGSWFVQSYKSVAANRRQNNLCKSSFLIQFMYTYKVKKFIFRGLSHTISWKSCQRLVREVYSDVAVCPRGLTLTAIMFHFYVPFKLKTVSVQT